MDTSLATAAATAAGTASATRDFTILRQRLSFDIDLRHQSVIGRAEITLVPQTKSLRQIRLNCRQCSIQSASVEDKPATFQYKDPYKNLKPRPSWGVRQHHLYKERLESCLGDNAREELTIDIPKKVVVKEATTTGSGDGILSRSKAGQLDSTTSGPTQDASIVGGAELHTDFTALTVKIDFTLKDVRDGLHFVGLAEGDKRYPSVYTQNGPYPGSACCLFPCVDDLTERYEWDISIRCPKILGDALGLPPMDPTISTTNDADTPMRDFEEDYGLSDQERLLELSIICSGQLEDESDDPTDETRKIVAYSTRDIYCSANQIGFAIGPFEQVDLSDLREVDEDDKLAEDAVQIIAYCLPGRAAEVKNTALPMAKAVDFFTERFTRYFYPTYQMCFLDDLSQDFVSTAGLSFLSTRLLFPQDIIDPIYEITHQVVLALASQYAGIGVTAREPADSWCIIGMAYFMTDLFMKSLCGNNEYRHRQKLAVDRIFEMDRERPSLHSLGSILQLDASEFEFIALKSAVVLFILDRRLTKSSTSSGVARIINRTLTNTKGGDAEATLLSTAQFQKTSERTGHTKLDSFFSQWVYGAGCPHFNVKQRFNKKKLVVEMTIEQAQTKPDSQQPSQLNPDTFLRDVKEELNEVWASPQGVFTGPMTIRIHEADGTPYEHIVDIKDATQKLEIPYNTKYKRLKRNRRNPKDPPKGSSAPAQESTGEDKDDVLLYCLGDVLQSEQEVREWNLSDWTADQEKQMSEDSYEWIRMDADFEWICKMEIQMSPWMHVSQLQQDRDVVAQYESLQYIGRQEPHPLISTFLTRTIMDNRYFHGIRTYAISLLPNVARDQVDWIGLTHLRKIFSELFCNPGTFHARANDFSDRAMYMVQCALPRALARVRDNSGTVPMTAKRIFVDTLKFNDNSQNEFSDCYWISTLMSCLADVLVKSPDHPPVTLPPDEQDEEDAFCKDAISEIERYRRIDEWISSHQNIYSRTALNCLLRLSKSGILQPKVADFLQYTRPGNSDQLRLQAFRCLIDLGKLKHGPILKYILHSIGNDMSPYMREQIQAIFGRGLGLAALGEDRSAKPANTITEGLIIEEGSTEERAQDVARKTTVEGAIKALKAEVGPNDALAQGLWNAITSPTLTLREIWQLLSIPEILYETENSLVVALKYPRYWRFHYEGDGQCRFTRDGSVRTRPWAALAPPRPSLINSLKNADKPAPARKLSMKLNINRAPSFSSEAGHPMDATSSVAATPTVQISMPPPSQRRTPAPERPTVKKETSPDIQRKSASVAPRRTKVIKLRVAKMKDPAYVSQLAQISPKPSAPSDNAQKKLKLNTGGGIKKEPTSPNLPMMNGSTPPASQAPVAGTPSEHRRPSTASSNSSKRGQKRKSAEREASVDHFTSANGMLTGERQSKRPRTSSAEPDKSETPAPPATPSYAPFSTPTSQQFGAWDTPVAGSVNGANGAQFGAWDSAEKARPADTGAGFAASLETPSKPAPRRRILKLKLPRDKLANAVRVSRGGSQGPQPTENDIMSENANIDLPKFAPVDYSAAASVSAHPEFGPIEQRVPVMDQPTVAASNGAVGVANINSVKADDSDDDAPMANRAKRPTLNSTIPAQAFSNE